jgi:hypothetical protein
MNQLLHHGVLIGDEGRKRALNIDILFSSI